MPLREHFFYDSHPYSYILASLPLASIMNDPLTITRELKHVGRQHDDDGNQYNESMKRNK